MATIQDYLDLIKNAIYGKDVRQAIHDGIQQCYYDGKAGAIDLEARQEIDSLISDITIENSEIIYDAEIVGDKTVTYQRALQILTFLTSIGKMRMIIQLMQVEYDLKTAHTI